MAANQQLTPQELQKLIDLYEQIDGLSSSAAGSAANNAQNLGNAFNELQRLERAARNLYRTFGHINELNQDILKALKDDTKVLQFHDTLISKANKILRETLEIRKGEDFANISKIKSLQRENQLNIELLENIKAKQLGNYDSLQTLQDEIDDLELIKGLYGSLNPNIEEELKNLKIRKDQVTTIQGQITELEGVNKELKDISKHDKELNKELGSGTQLITNLFGGSK
jgi:hypothetical protein